MLTAMQEVEEGIIQTSDTLLLFPLPQSPKVIRK